MNCKKCGESLQENENICAKCGTDNRDADENISAAPKLRGFPSKKNITIIALAGVLALGIGGTAAAVSISNAPANRVSRYMGAAERYLSEMNYEQAIIEFQRILEIDPMNADAYLGMAEAYIALGDIDNAVEILRTGLEQTGDDRIRERLNELLLSLALERGNTYLSEEKYTQAESEFSDALEIDEKCVEAYLGKADSHIGENAADKAIEVLQKGFDTTGDNGIKEKLDDLKLSEALKHGREYLTAAKYQQAESEFSGALGIDKKCVEAYIGKADSHIGTEDIDKAIEVLQTGFDITGDSVIKEKLDALIEKQSMPKLSWSNVDSDILYVKYGHYIKRDNDLWQPCDENGTPITDKKYKYIEDFGGTDEASYTLVTTEDGKVFCVDKNYNELFDVVAENEADYGFSTKLNLTVVDSPEPLFLSWSLGSLGAGQVTQGLNIYTPNGKVYQWKRDECLDGSGVTANFNDSVFAFSDEVKAKYVDGEIKYDRENVKVNLVGFSAVGSKIYVSYTMNIPWSGGWAGGYVTEAASFIISVEDGVVKFDKNGESFYGAIYEKDDITIFSNIHWNWEANRDLYILGDGNDKKAFIARNVYSTNPGNPVELGCSPEEMNFFRVASLVNDKYMICQYPDLDAAENVGKTVFTGYEKSEYALYKINWEDYDEVYSGYEDSLDIEHSIQYNAKHERVSEFYDGIYLNDGDQELGYLLVSNDGKWGYISLETREELAMYDDASSFSNGYAVVTNNGKGWVIDSEFNVVSDEFPCESAHILGDGSFIVTNGSEIKRLEIKK